MKLYEVDPSLLWLDVVTSICAYLTAVMSCGRAVDMRHAATWCSRQLVLPFHAKHDRVFIYIINRSSEPLRLNEIGLS